MKNLMLSEWSNVAEIIASIVIVFSLVYVGRELSQNTTSMQQSSYQSTLEMLTQGDLLLASDNELNVIVSTAETSPSELSDAEWSRFSRYATPRIGAWEYMYLAKQTNSISDSQWTAFEPYFVYLICTKGYNQFFGQNRVVYDAAFRRYVDGKVSANCT